MTRLRRIVSGIRPLRIPRYAHDLELPVVIRAIPVASPLPDIARHVIELISVRGKLRDWRDSGIPILAGIVIREMALMRISHPFAMRTKLVAPDIRFA